MADDLVLTHQEVMILLSGHAARGSIGAAIALERALRQAEKDREEDPVGDAIQKILAD